MAEIILKVCLCILAYLIGAINFARIFAKFRKIDITKEGSGNPGTMNALRTAGKMVGLLTFIFDVVKGLAFGLAGRLLFGIDWCFILGFLAVVGHVFPIYTKFKGGKGVATTMGVFIAACPIAGIIVLAGLTVFAFVFKYGFVGSVGAVSIMSVFATLVFSAIPSMYLRGSHLIITLTLCWAIWAIVMFKHRGNFIRFFKGQENVLDIMGKKNLNRSETPKNEVDKTTSALDKEINEVDKISQQNNNEVDKISQQNNNEVENKLTK